MSETKTAKDIVSMIKTEKVEVVDLRFMDFPGTVAAFFDPRKGSG